MKNDIKVTETRKDLCLMEGHEKKDGMVIMKMIDMIEEIGNIKVMKKDTMKVGIAKINIDAMRMVATMNEKEDQMTKEKQTETIRKDIGNEEIEYIRN